MTTTQVFTLICSSIGHDHEDEAWDVEIRPRLGLDGGAE